MTRRALLLAPVVLLSTSHDRRRERHNRNCARWGERRERNGLTDRERAFLERKGCKKENGEWMSALFFAA